ncbi:MAG: carboxypeptidase-like regulatory domain-containing protein [Actinobacteria bacterium]|nr:carboxypeptidase-like regulatory domain-containing protein [Actinomycetota bacterium]
MRNNTTNPVRRILATVAMGTAAALALAVAPVQASAKPFVQPASFISGRLVDASTHQPLAGVRVASYSYGDDSTASAISDANGRFVLARVTGDEFAVLVRSSARHCGGFVKVLERAAGAPLDAIVTTRDNSNTFMAGHRGTIGVFRFGSRHCR